MKNNLEKIYNKLRPFEGFVTTACDFQHFSSAFFINITILFVFYQDLNFSSTILVNLHSQRPLLYLIHFILFHTNIYRYRANKLFILRCQKSSATFEIKIQCIALFIIVYFQVYDVSSTLQ